MVNDVKMVDIEKIKIINDKDNLNTNTTFSFQGEDHTIGNLVRSILIKDPEVEFCGYSVPHPSENIMNIRLQTYTSSCDKTLNKALNTVCQITDFLSQKFEDSLSKFKKENINMEIEEDEI